MFYVIQNPDLIDRILFTYHLFAHPGWLGTLDEYTTIVAQLMAIAACGSASPPVSTEMGEMIGALYILHILHNFNVSNFTLNDLIKYN